MADTIDQACDREALDRERSIDAARRTVAGPVATGLCLSCDEPLTTGLRWCDASCRDDWQRTQRTTR